MRRTVRRRRQHRRFITAEEARARILADPVTAQYRAWLIERETLCLSLPHHRARSGLTVEQVAARMRVDPIEVVELEGGVDTDPPLSTLQAYATAVGCELDVRVREAWS